MLRTRGLFEVRPDHEDSRDPKSPNILKVISRNGAVDVLRSLYRRPLRFSEIMFETKLNPAVLTRHLKTLGDMGFVKKRGGLYELTPKGDQLVNLICELLAIFA